MIRAKLTERWEPVRQVHL